MNALEKFNTQIQSFYGFMLPPNYLSKALFNQLDNLNDLIFKSVENQINIFEAIHFIIKKNPRSLTPDAAKIVFRAMNNHSEMLSDELITSFCSIKLEYGDPISTYFAQLKILNHLKDLQTKFIQVKEIYSKILSVSNILENQHKIIAHWKSLKQDPKEIMDLIPQNTQAIKNEVLEMHVTTIDCNILAKNNNLKNSIYTFNAIKIMLNIGKKLHPEMFEYSKSNHQNNKINIISLDGGNSKLIEPFVNHFFNKLILLNKVSATALEIEKIISKEDLEKIMLASHLDESLNSRPALMGIKI